MDSTAVESKSKSVQIRFSDEQIVALNRMRRKMKTTKTRVLEVALSDLFERNGDEWPENVRRIA